MKFYNMEHSLRECVMEAKDAAFGLSIFLVFLRKKAKMACILYVTHTLIYLYT